MFCYSKREANLSDISNVIIGKQTGILAHKKMIKTLEMLTYKNRKLEKKIKLEYNKNNYVINGRDVNELYG